MQATIVDRVRTRVLDGALLSEAPLVVVMLSGGRDSACLLDVSVDLLGKDHVSVLHVNYGLRVGADADEAVCVAMCDRLGADLVVERPPARDGGNLQAWAREVRHEAGLRLAGSTGALLATAHTRTDQVETILYRLAASPGRRALLGMADRTGRIVRPLLTTTREETTDYCRERNLAYVDDPTNGTDEYARGRVRNGLVPALRAIHPAAECNVVRTAELLRDEGAVLDSVVDATLAGRDDIDVGQLATLPPALARLILRRLAEDAVGGLCARVPGRLDDLVALGDGALDLGDGARAVVEHGVLRMERTPPLSPRSTGR